MSCECIEGLRGERVVEELKTYSFSETFERFHVPTVKGMVGLADDVVETFRGRVSGGSRFRNIQKR